MPPNLIVGNIFWKLNLATFVYSTSVFLTSFSTLHTQIDSVDVFTEMSRR